MGEDAVESCEDDTQREKHDGSLERIVMVVLPHTCAVAQSCCAPVRPRRRRRRRRCFLSPTPVSSTRALLLLAYLYFPFFFQGGTGQPRGTLPHTHTPVSRGSSVTRPRVSDQPANTAGVLLHAPENVQPSHMYRHCCGTFTPPVLASCFTMVYTSDCPPRVAL